MSGKAKDAMGVERLEMLADRGYFSGEEILACEQAGVTPYVPKPLTSGAKADGRFGKQDFAYVPEEDAYRCPGGRPTPIPSLLLTNASPRGLALSATCP